MPKPGRTGLSRILHALGYSMQGLAAAFKNEAAFRQEVALVLVMLPVAIWLAPGFIEMAFLMASLFLVLIIELLNSAIEAVVDRIGDEHHELAGRAKDIGSAAVFITLALVVVIWGLVLIPYYF